MEDDVLEENEMFSVTLTTTSDDVVLNPSTADVTITDDGMLVRILCTASCANFKVLTKGGTPSKQDSEILC